LAKKIGQSGERAQRAARGVEVQSEDVLAGDFVLDQ
jgi:hypothetical protein